MKKVALITIISMLFLSMSFAQTHHFKFKVTDKSELKKLTKIISIDNYKDNYVWAYANDKQFAEFSKLNYTAEYLPLHNNSAKVINMAATRAEMANWDRYPTYDCYLEMMNYYPTTYPNLCQLVNIGTSQNGRQIIALKISDNVTQQEAEPEFFYTSTMHGDETTGIVLTLRLADFLLSNYGTDPDATYIVDNFQLYINPEANPDGTYAGGNDDVTNSTRYLANGNDPNRDYPYPLNINHTTSNPETNDMMAFASAHNFVMSANFHGGAEVFNYPWDCWSSDENTPTDDNWFSHIGTNYVTSARILNSSYMTSVVPSGVTEGADWYYANGTRQDYMNYFHHCKEITVELSNQKTLSSSSLPTYWDYNKQSLLDFIKEANYGFNGTVKNVDDEALDAKIEILSYDKDNSWVITNPTNGDYYRPIKPGTYGVTYSSEGYISQTHTVTVTDWKTTTIENVILLRANDVQLSGTVIDAQSALPIENAQISFLGTSIDDVYTDSQGHYSLTITENEYQIKAYKAGYSQQIITETVSSENNTIDFALLVSDAITFEGEVPSDITFEGNLDWFQSDDQAYEGTYSIKSGAISDDQETTMVLTTTTEAGTISFYKKVSCEDDSNDDWDYLKFEIDGVEQGRWDGIDTDWSQQTYAISAGSHIFKWTYKKDGSVLEGDDCAWVDYIELPTSALTTYDITFTVKDGANNTTIEGASVNLAGYGVQYTNNSGVATFTDVYETEGTNTVSYIVSADGFSDETGEIQVLGNVSQIVNMQTNVNVSILEQNISIYPNPSQGYFKVESNNIINKIKITDISGRTISEYQPNNKTFTVKDLSSGMYFITIYTNASIVTKKIIVN